MIKAADLREFDLDAYESEAYLALLRLGVSKAYAISKESGVPNGKIYPVLASLERKGFVQVYEGNPKRFMAVEPSVCIEKSVERKETEASALRGRAERLVASLASLSSSDASEPLNAVRIIEGYKNYLNLSVELHRKAKKNYLSISRLPLYKPHLDAYSECARRGVTVRLLTAITDANKEHLAAWKATGSVIREIGYLPTRFSVIDDTDVVIRISGEKKYLALWIQNQSLAKSLQDYFAMLWKDAKTV